jgi:hypothetical protein
MAASMGYAARHMAKSRFAFEEAPTTSVIVCKRVLAGKSVLEVAHDEDGSWQFLCGSDHSEVDEDGPDGPAVVPLRQVVDQDPSLNELADLLCNEAARRARKGAKWARHDQTEDLIREAVDEHGWFVAKIPAGDGDDEPPFAYTVGLRKTFGFPELIVVGLRLEIMHAMLNEFGERLKAGEKLAAEGPISDIIEGFDVRLRAVAAEASFKDHVGYAIWFNGGLDFPLLQVVWPDKKGKFPGEKGAASVLKKQQPLLP